MLLGMFVPFQPCILFHLDKVFSLHQFSRTMQKWRKTSNSNFHKFEHIFVGLINKRTQNCNVAK